MEQKSLLLADYVTAIHMIFPPGTEVFAGDGFNVYVTMKTLPTVDSEDEDDFDLDADTDTDAEGDAQSFIESFILKLEMHTKSRVGIFLLMSTPAGVNISVDKALHFAKAALVASTNKPFIRFFRPAQTLTAWKNLKCTDDAFADYKAFRSYGIVDPYMENQLGLSFLSADDASKYSLAEIAFGNAKFQEPKNQIFAANAALAKGRLSKFDEAYELFKSISASFFEGKHAPSYSITYAKSALELSKTGGINAIELHDLLSRLFSTGTHFGVKMHPTYETWIKELRELNLIS